MPQWVESLIIAPFKSPGSLHGGRWGNTLTAGLHDCQCTLASFPAMEEGEEKECLVYCLCMCLIAEQLLGNCVCTTIYVYWWCHKLTCHVNVPVGGLFDLIFYHCSMPCCTWLPQYKAEERTGCLQWVHLPRKYIYLYAAIHQLWLVDSYHCLPDPKATLG